MGIKERMMMRRTPWRIRINAVLEVLKLFHGWVYNVTHYSVFPSFLLIREREEEEEGEKKVKQKKKKKKQKQQEGDRKVGKSAEHRREEYIKEEERTNMPPLYT